MPTTAEDNRLLAVGGAVLATLLGGTLLCGLILWQFSQPTTAQPPTNRRDKNSSTADNDRAAQDAADDQLAGQSVTTGSPPLVEMPQLPGVVYAEPEEDLLPEVTLPDNSSTLSVRPYRSDEIEIPPYDPPLVPGAELELPEEAPVVDAAPGVDAP